MNDEIVEIGAWNPKEPYYEYLWDTPIGNLGNWDHGRVVGSGVLGGRHFADLTKFDRKCVTDRDLTYTMQLSREIFDLEEPRFDGICYSSRIEGVTRWAIFDREVDDQGVWVTQREVSAIKRDDPDLIRALAHLKLKLSNRGAPL